MKWYQIENQNYILSQMAKKKQPKKKITLDAINSNGKLTHLVASSLFENDRKEIFHAGNGKWIGSITPGQEFNFEEEKPEVSKEETIINPQQISLF